MIKHGRQSKRAGKRQSIRVSAKSGGRKLTGGTSPTAVVISAVSFGTPNATDATITWTTDVLSDSQVFWGTTTAYGGATSPIMNFSLVTSHSVTITGLVTATLYHYKVLSRNPATGGYAFSSDDSFTTA